MNTSERDDMVIRMYLEKRNASIVSEMTGVDRSMIQRILKKNGIQTFGKNFVGRRNRKRDEEIVSYLNIPGNTCRDASEKWGISISRIQQIAPLPKPLISCKERDAAILKEIPSSGVTYRHLEAAAKKFGMEYETIRRILTKYDIFMEECRPIPKSKTTIEIEEMLRAGIDIIEIVKRTGKQRSQVLSIKSRANI